ncbi:methionine--tRNA ligase [Sneathia sp. DSM 16631]|uniref:methionine--tRNA ligase n=1 Tax=Sneathia sp. DSM 16631 TaxID=2777994 RepID=UPI0018695153|nr:methionine--tRNA ligase [Sneathia sp. DSM 16631]MBE2989612.1 methionine--tRNA ligase [Sneathia sp. DSM 16630]MBE3031266.1 methionine--tRNA ligase [Sneathia sp. DSM 16631]
MKYITTPIYYPNAKAHIGTAYTTILCDTLARYERLYGQEVKFLTGTDEHGQKIQESAEKNKVTPQQWVDKMSKDFIDLWKALSISNDDFIRTTEQRHIDTVQKILQKVYDNGDIYLGEYKGKYCVSEETFVTESQLVDGKYMGKEVIEVSEPSYFFRLSKYADKLLKYYEEHDDFIIPKQRKNELIAFINQGLQDLSISRTSFNWGIPINLTEEKNHIVYVWFDALTNYLTGAKYGTDEEYFNHVWNNGDIYHFVGKDILRFHAIIWPAMLMSAGIKLPDHIVAHGWWTVNGEKMSKSLGNVVDPIEEVEKYGVDAFRYFLLRESTLGQDADYSENQMVLRINADLANDLGNLLNRTLGMQKKYFGEVVKESGERTEIEDGIYKLYNEVLKDVYSKVEEANFSKALESIWKLISRMNKYIDETMPWSLFKENNLDRLRTVMYTLFDMIYKCSYLVSPVLIDSSKKMLNQLGVVDIKTNIYEIGDYMPNTKIGNASPIFPRIEKKEKEFDDELKIQDAINIDDFSKVKISVVEILKVSEVESSDRLLKFIVDTGKEKRQILSGIKHYYKEPKKLVGKKVLAVLNLEPVKLVGNISQGMLLTTEQKKNVRLIEISDEVKVGAKVK